MFLWHQGWEDQTSNGIPFWLEGEWAWEVKTPALLARSPIKGKMLSTHISILLTISSNPVLSGQMRQDMTINTDAYQSYLWYLDQILKNLSISSLGEHLYLFQCAICFVWMNEQKFPSKSGLVVSESFFSPLCFPMPQHTFQFMYVSLSLWQGVPPLTTLHRSRYLGLLFHKSRTRMLSHSQGVLRNRIFLVCLRSW